MSEEYFVKQAQALVQKTLGCWRILLLNYKGQVEKKSYILESKKELDEFLKKREDKIRKGRLWRIVKLKESW